MPRGVNQLIAECLKSYGIPYVAGIPGHGNWALVDAFADSTRAPRFVQVMHEQSAIHMADAQFRLTGRPGAATASIGPGAANTLMGLATAFSDSSACLLITGAAATHMRGHGVMQSLDRKYAPDFPRLAEAATKAAFDIVSADSVPTIMHRAFNAMTTGRPGPVSIDVPLDLQVATTEIDIQDLEYRLPKGRVRPDSRTLETALELLLNAERPCIVAGGGVLTAGAATGLRTLAERLEIPVVFTWNGKGAFPEEHPLCVGPIGVAGSLAENRTSGSADVLLALGCRFTDWSSSSFRRGVTYAIPPSRLIQVDIDPEAIGRSYPAEVGIIADIRRLLEDLDAGISDDQARRAREKRAPYLDRIVGRKRIWQETLETRRAHGGIPASMLAVLAELRRVLPRQGIVTVGSGHCQGAVRQGFPVFEPGTHITSGGYSSMGFAVPAAMAAKLARSDAPVVAIVGDGDMLMSVHELATCVMNGLAVVFLVLNNAGFLSIRDGQNALFDRTVGAEFRRAREAASRPYSPDFAGIGRCFGLDFAERVTDFRALREILGRSLAHGGPAIVEVPITTDPALAGAEPAGWWDFPPGPSASQEIWADYRAGRAAEQHLGAATDDVEIRPPLGIYG